MEAVFDTNGRLSKRFGVETSGTAILYDTDGKQLFHGGITSSRGHEGGNVGATAIEAFVLKTHANCASAPVFGCSLHNLKTNETDE